MSDFSMMDRQELSLPMLAGLIMLGPNTANAGATLSTIAMMRDVLQYLEARYAQQCLEMRDRATEAAQAPAFPQRKKEAARKRERRSRGNGADRPQRDTPLPFHGQPEVQVTPAEPEKEA